MADQDSAFTAFGKVMARIAACEQIMRLALIHREFETSVRAGNSGSERFGRFVSKLQKKDFGQLSHLIRTQFKLPDDPWLQIFKDAKGMRNSVAHEFWSPNYGLLEFDRGIEIIVRHCTVLDRHFEHLNKGILHVTGLDPRLFIKMVTEPKAVEEAINGFDKLLKNAEEAIADLQPWQ